MDRHMRQVRHYHCTPRHDLHWVRLGVCVCSPRYKNHCTVNLLVPTTFNSYISFISPGINDGSAGNGVVNVRELV